MLCARARPSQLLFPHNDVCVIRRVRYPGQRLIGLIRFVARIIPERFPIDITSATGQRDNGAAATVRFTLAIVLCCLGVLLFLERGRDDGLHLIALGLLDEFIGPVQR